MLFVQGFLLFVRRREPKIHAGKVGMRQKAYLSSRLTFMPPGSTYLLVRLTITRAVSCFRHIGSTNWAIGSVFLLSRLILLLIGLTIRYACLTITRFTIYDLRPDSHRGTNCENCSQWLVETHGSLHILYLATRYKIPNSNIQIPKETAST